MSPSPTLESVETVYVASTSGKPSPTVMHRDGDCRYLQKAKNPREVDPALYPPNHRTLCERCWDGAPE